jgi:hypothetical protein
VVTATGKPQSGTSNGYSRTCCSWRGEDVTLLICIPQSIKRCLHKWDFQIAKVTLMKCSYIPQVNSNTCLRSLHQLSMQVYLFIYLFIMYSALSPVRWFWLPSYVENRIYRTSDEGQLVTGFPPQRPADRSNVEEFVVDKLARGRDPFQYFGFVVSSNSPCYWYNGRTDRGVRNGTISPPPHAVPITSHQLKETWNVYLFEPLFDKEYAFYLYISFRVKSVQKFWDN